MEKATLNNVFEIAHKWLSDKEATFKESKLDATTPPPVSITYTLFKDYLKFVITEFSIAINELVSPYTYEDEWVIEQPDENTLIMTTDVAEVNQYLKLTFTFDNKRVYLEVDKNE